MMTEVKVPNSQKSFTAVWDSGASPTLVKYSMYREQEEVKEKDHKDPRNLPSPLVPRELLVSGILEGEPVKALGETQMTFEMGGKTISHRCYVFQDEIINFPGDCDVLVGSSLMHEHKLILDFDKWRICQGSKVL